jgi:hypothetical protein
MGAMGSGLVPTAIVMLKRIGKPSARRDISKEGPR